MTTRLNQVTISAALFAWAILARGQDAPRYAVTFDAQTQSASVQLCLEQAHANVEFAADSGWAMRFVSDLRRTGAGADKGAKVIADDSGWHALDWRAGECLAYRADLHAIAQEHKP